MGIYDKRADIRLIKNEIGDDSIIFSDGVYHYNGVDYTGANREGLFNGESILSYKEISEETIFEIKDIIENRAFFRPDN